MGFYDDEKSIEHAMPIQLLDFAAGSDHWRYSTGTVAMLYGANVYNAQSGLVCGKIEVGANAMRARFEVKVPWSCTLVQEYIDGAPDDVVTLTVYRIHTDTAGAGGHDAVIWWRGYVQSVVMSSDHTATITCVPNYTDLGRAGLCLRYGRTCQVPLYSDECGVVKEDYSVAGDVDSVSGFDVVSSTFDTYDDGYFTGGEFASEGYTRLIIAHTGDTITLASTIPGLDADSTFNAYPGCDHIYASDCKDRFSNTLNFRGQPHIPLANPNKEGVV